MSASARFVVYSTVTGTILRAGRCPVGQESIQANTSNAENYLDEAQVAAVLPSLGNDEHLSDAKHFIDVDDGNEVKLRVAMDVSLAYRYLNVTVPSFIEQDNVKISNLPTTASNPSVVGTTTTFINSLCEVEGITDVTSSSFETGFPSGLFYEVIIEAGPLFNPWPKYLPFKFQMGGTSDGMFYSARAYPQLGRLKTTIAVGITGVAASGAVGDPSMGRFTDTTVTATGALGALGVSIDMDATVEGVEATGLVSDAGDLNTALGREIVGVSATTAVATLERTYFGDVVGETATGELSGDLSVEIVEDGP